MPSSRDELDDRHGMVFGSPMTARREKMKKRMKVTR